MVSLQTTLVVLALAGAPQEETAVLDFYADWCGPCQQMSPLVHQLAAAGYPIRKVNFDQNRSLAARYGVDRLPTFVLVVKGRVVDRVIGATSHATLERMCRQAQAARPDAKAAPPVAIASNTDGSVVIPAVASEPAFSAGSPPPIIPAVATSTDSGAVPGWRLPAQTLGLTGRRGLSDQEFIARTVRLRIEDSGGQSCGSGTIVDARQGEALILTCGHLFRDSKGKGRILVDLFGASPAEGIPGRLICYNLDRDVALLSIQVSGPVAVAKVAPSGTKVACNDRVINVGCSSGAAPTVRHSSINAKDKFTGPANLTVAGLPVQGRSGGGLFSSEGLLIGVCFAANPSENEGLYAALESIYAELDHANLGYVYQPETKPSDAASALVALEPPPMPKQMPVPADIVQLTEAPLRPRTVEEPQRPDAAGELTAEERDALAEIRRRRAEGAEVICVIRSRTSPDARSEIIYLEKASDEFLRQLARETRRLDSRELSSVQRPSVEPVSTPRAERADERIRLLEWSAPAQ